MATVAVRYVGPQDERYLPDLGVTVKRGGTVEVSDTFAGVEPSGGDLGTGLLAQVDVWKRADKSKAGAKTTTADSTEA